MSDKWIELIKWFVASVVIVVVTMIIDAGFREREAGIKEMEVYDRYVEIILKADNIEQRWKLCEYFSIVTPTERLRLRWQAYKDTISADYMAWKRTKDTITLERSLNDSPLIGEYDLAEPKDAKSIEEEGFDALVKKDYGSALSSFLSAERKINGLHNCYEISAYLKESPELKDPGSSKWKELYGKMVKDWSWGVPKEYLDSYRSSR
jgi:hypothetical protein